MWQLTFAGSITDEKDIPNDISDLLKETEKSLETSLSSSLSHSNSEVGGTSSSGFAMPLAFSNMFKKKNNPEKPSEKTSAIAKKTC
jgi:hypothetical protein